jgi:hypothetical protein
MIITLEGTKFTNAKTEEKKESGGRGKNVVFVLFNAHTSDVKRQKKTRSFILDIH